MTTTKARVLKLVATLVAGLTFCVSAKAQSEIVYNNTTNPAGNNAGYSGAFEFGDEVALQGVGRTLTEFQFEYFGNLNESANKFMLLSIYNNNGVGGAPGTLLYQSDPIQIHNDYHQTDISSIKNVTLSDSVIWTITPVNLTGGDEVSLLLYNPPSVGSSANDFWQKNALGSWARNVINDPSGTSVANFGAKITVVPEPTAAQLLMFAGAGYLVFVGYKRRTVRAA